MIRPPMMQTALPPAAQQELANNLANGPANRPPAQPVEKLPVPGSFKNPLHRQALEARRNAMSPEEWNAEVNGYTPPPARGLFGSLANSGAGAVKTLGGVSGNLAAGLLDPVGIFTGEDILERGQAAANALTGGRSGNADVSFAQIPGDIWHAVQDGASAAWDRLQGPAIGTEALPQLTPQGPGSAPGGVLSTDAQGALDRSQADARALTMGSAPQVGAQQPGQDPAQQDVLRRLLAAIEAPQGPSEAQAALRLGTAQNAANLLGLARSAGTAGDRSAAIGNALFQGAGQAQTSLGQQAQLVAQEQAARRAQVLEGLGLAGDQARAARDSDLLARGQTLESGARDADRQLDLGRLGLDTQKLGQEFALGLGELGQGERELDLRREAENRLRVQGTKSLFDQLLAPTGDVLALLAKYIDS